MKHRRVATPIIVTNYNILTVNMHIFVASICLIYAYSEYICDKINCGGYITILWHKVWSQRIHPKIS